MVVFYCFTILIIRILSYCPILKIFEAKFAKVQVVFVAC